MPGRRIRTLTPLSLENDSLLEVRESFDTMVTDILNVMNKKGLNAGTVTLKIGIKLTEGCEDTELGERKVIIPVFDYKVTGSYQEKSELGNSFGGPDYELIEMDGGWGIKSYSNGQMEMDV